MDSRIRSIRLDPAFAACIVTLKQVLWNGVSIAEEDTALNIHPNGAWMSDDSIVFETQDPGIEFGFTSEQLKRTGKDHLTVTLVMALVSEEIAADLVRYQMEDPQDTKENEEEKNPPVFGRLQKIFHR